MPPARPVPKAAFKNSQAAENVTNADREKNAAATVALNALLTRVRDANRILADFSKLLIDTQAKP